MPGEVALRFFRRDAAGIAEVERCWLHDGSRRIVTYPRLMHEAPVQILEVRAGERQRPVKITCAVTADASQAVFTALSEQLDRRRLEPIATVEELLALREQVALIERCAPLATGGAHALICLSHADLRACLLELSSYASRVGGEHYQPAELRERLQTIARITPILWDANANARR